MDDRPAQVGGIVAVAGAERLGPCLLSGLRALRHRHAGRAGWAALGGGRAVGQVEHGGLGALLGGLVDAVPRSRNGLAWTGYGAGPACGALGRGLAWGLAAGEPVAVALAGTIHNGAALREQLVERGSLMGGDGDAELVLHLLAASRQRTLVNRLVEALARVEGAFCLTVASPELVVVARDPRGIRPAWLGHSGPAHLVAPEASVITSMGGVPLREVAPGEVVILEEGALPQALRPWVPREESPCLLEWLLLARLDASFNGVGVHSARRRVGAALAEDVPAEAELVAALPGECMVAAMGYAEAAGLPLEQAFVPPSPGSAADCRRKGGRELLALAGAVCDRSVVLVVSPSDGPALVRRASARLRDAGVRAIHVRVAGPLLVVPCPYGVRHGRLGPIPVGRDERAAVGRRLGADSLAVLSADATLRAVRPSGKPCCAACAGQASPLGEQEARATPQLPLFDARDGS